MLLARLDHFKFRTRLGVPFALDPHNSSRQHRIVNHRDPKRDAFQRQLAGFGFESKSAFGQPAKSRSRQKQVDSG